MGRGGVVLRKRHDVRGASGRAGRPRGNPRRIQRLRLSHPTRLRSTTFASSTRIVRADSGSPQDPVARTRHLSGDHGKSLAPSGRTQPLIQAHKVQSRCTVPRCMQPVPMPIADCQRLATDASARDVPPCDGSFLTAESHARPLTTVGHSNRPSGDRSGKHSPRVHVGRAQRPSPRKPPPPHEKLRIFIEAPHQHFVDRLIDQQRNQRGTVPKTHD